MNTEQYLKQVAYTKEHEELGSLCWWSKFDDSYITHVGMEDGLKFFAENEITIDLTHGVGKSQKDGKWYGWSHRAIYGFEIGSTCKKGDCHYIPSTPEELIDSHSEFFSDIGDKLSIQKREECQILDDRSGIRILHTPIKLPIAPSISDAIDAAIGGSKASDFPEQVIDAGFSVIKCGRGEWTAKTDEDAKQMAIDFNEGVS